MNGIQQIPKDWKWVKLGEVCDKISLNKIKIKQKDYLEEGLYPVVDQGQSLIGGYYNNESLLIPNSPPYIIYGDHTKIKKYINFNFIAGADGVKVLKAKETINSKFLFYSLFTIKIEDKGYARHFQLLEKELFLLPPKSTQQAIVSKIEELFSELDKGIENMRTAQQQLKTYRQAVLKWAFEGKLTNENVKDEELPKGWKLVNMDFLLSNLKKGMGTGPFGTMLKKHEHQKIGVPVLGIENIGEGVFQMPNKIFVTDEKAIELKNFRVQENDIIISRSGTVGEICLLPKKMENSIISTNLIRVSLNLEIINPKYFVYLFQGGKVRQQVLDLCKGSSRAFLNQTILNSLDIPFCSLKEQNKIIQEIERRLSVADKMEESITQSLQQAEALRQSILKKAFEGKLL